MLRRLLHRFGKELTPFPAPPSRDTKALIRVLQHHQIMTVLDVGANVGQYAKRIRTGGYRERIVSFEPLSAAHRQLAEAAGFDPKWQVAPRLAIGDTDGRVTLNVSAESDMSSMLKFRPDWGDMLDSSAFIGEETVDQRRLATIFDEWVKPGERTLLKIDTQGYESKVLDGALPVMDRIHGIQLEMALVEVYEGEPLWRDMMARIESLGFTLVLLIPGYFNRRTARLIQVDGVFMRASEVMDARKPGFRPLSYDLPADGTAPEGEKGTDKGAGG
ncbi:MAG TPA: FkbM family methyltransferase [Alphaproteobacteria bacterium]|nr:FkbM family methyltransferase [Alphaproteobacteria bacterium]